jgi:GNAT superfamily N-acetyltransferase
MARPAGPPHPAAQPVAPNDDVVVLPATAERFPDLAVILGTRSPDTPACWCLSYRLPSRENRALTPRERPAAVLALCSRPVRPGVLGYLDGEVVGWAGVAPRAELNSFARSRRIPHLDDLPVWTAWCFRVRAGYGGHGVATALLAGAVEFAREHGAPAIEGYPVDNGGRRIDRASAYVGTRAMFERVGFTKAADTDAIGGGMPRVLMRLDLR